MQSQIKEKRAIMSAQKISFVVGLAYIFVGYVGATDTVPTIWGYSGSIGPEKWGSLSPEFHLCSYGKLQSPINIDKDVTVYDSNLQRLKRKYIDANASLINNKFNLELRYEQGVGNVFVEGKNYSLQQMHWHSPSEHLIDGKRFPFELHLVHKTKEGNITVVAILYKFGHADPFLFQLKKSLEQLAKEKCASDELAKVPVGKVRNKAMTRATRKYYRYVGSLTAPPCLENVIWNVLGKVREMTQEQAAALRVPLDVGNRNNSRPIQSINGRTVRLYDESKRSSS